MRGTLPLPPPVLRGQPPPPAPRPSLGIGAPRPPGENRTSRAGRSTGDSFRGKPVGPQPPLPWLSQGKRGPARASVCWAQVLLPPSARRAPLDPGPWDRGLQAGVSGSQGPHGDARRSRPTASGSVSLEEGETPAAVGLVPSGPSERGPVNRHRHRHLACRASPFRADTVAWVGMA